MLLAWLKLRKRSLGPILDANGWAVNTHASISLPFGATLTKVASLPAGAQRSLRDPFAQKSRSGWWWLLLLIVVFAGAAGYWQWSQAVHPLAAKEKVVVVKPDAASVTKPE